MDRPLHDTIGLLVILAALVTLLAAATGSRPGRPVSECRYGHSDASGLECDHIMSSEQADSIYAPLLDSLKSASPEGDIIL